MIRRHKMPSRSQWAILAALAETGRLTRKGGRYVAAERAARTFAFIPVMHLVQRGFARATDANLSGVEPTPLCHHVLAARTGQAPSARPPGPAIDSQPQESRP
jgi:hypothetical protein